MSDTANFGKDILARQNGFVRMEYLIDQSGLEPKTSRKVTGWAFEVPGWPEFHACVRFDIVYPWDTFNEWQIDHYESGLKCGGIDPINSMEEAPGVLEKRLTELGRERVIELLRKHA